MLTLLYEIKLNGDVFNPCYEVRRLQHYCEENIGSGNFGKYSIKNPTGIDSRLTEASVKEMVETLANGIANSKGFNWKIKEFIIIKYCKDTVLVVVTYQEKIVDIQNDIEKLRVRRLNLFKRTPVCLSCHSKQVQLVDYNVIPAQWKCRRCKKEFTFE